MTRAQLHAAAVARARRKLRIAPHGQKGTARKRFQDARTAQLMNEVKHG